MSLNPCIPDWRGRSVWLVGASTGIGRAAASALHAKGARVAVSARQGELLDAFVAEHPGSLAVPLDVLDPASLRAGVERVLHAHDRIDLAVYCAGYFRPMGIDNFDFDEARRHLDVNYLGALRLLEALLPQLRRQAAAGQGGHLSLISSVAGYRGLPKALGYGPSKAALTHLAEALYLDMHPLGLGVSVVHPGFVTTPMTAQNDFHMPAEITPEQAAAAMLAGWQAGDFEIHFPKRFTLAMKALRLLGDAAYFRLINKFAR